MTRTDHVFFGSLTLSDYGEIMSVMQPYAEIESSFEDNGLLGQVATGVALKCPEIEVTVLLPFSGEELQTFMRDYYSVLMYPTLNDTWWRLDIGHYDADEDEMVTPSDAWRLARLKQAPEFHEYVNCTVMTLTFIAKEPWLRRNNISVSVASGATGRLYVGGSRAIETPLRITGTLEGEYTPGTTSQPVEFEILEGSVVKAKIGFDPETIATLNVVIDTGERVCTVNGNQVPIGDDYDWVQLKGRRTYGFRMSKGSGDFTVTVSERLL